MGEIVISVQQETAQANLIKVLLVEDDPADARYITELLSEVESGACSIAVEHRCGLYDGMARLAEGNVDAILLNLELYGCEGIDAFTQVHQQATGVPVLVLTGPDGETLGLEAVKHGAQDHLVKGQIDGRELARSVRYAVERARLLYRLHELAIRDELTGLYNRREMVRLLGDEVARYRRWGRPAALVILDIDNFKDVNDTYGHQVGDAVLQEMGQMLLTSLRSLDRSARYGGEEMAIILPETTADKAFVVAERLRELVSILPLTVSRVEGTMQPMLVPITISAGVAALSHGIESPEALISAADGALYEAKRQGRNRTVLYADGTLRMSLPTAW